MHSYRLDNLTEKELQEQIQLMTNSIKDLESKRNALATELKKRYADKGNGR
jgi:arsenate reductase-like glutaredoxin family protein